MALAIEVLDSWRQVSDEICYMTDTRSLIPIRLQNAVANIEELRNIMKVSSLSIGVIHEDKLIFSKGLGQANIQDNRVPDLATVYSVGSCTKSFTASILALLAREQRLSFDAEISAYVPEIRDDRSSTLPPNATLTDLLSHSSGLAAMLFACIGKYVSVIPRWADQHDICTKLPQAAPPRSTWSYNNWPYGLMSPLITRVSQYGWSHCMHRIFDALHMDRTYTTHPKDDNYARSYAILDSGETFQAPLTTLDAGMSFDSSGSVRSCVEDMLVWCRAIIKATKVDTATLLGQDEPSSAFFETHTGQHEQKLIQAMHSIVQPRFPLSPGSAQNYCFGIYDYHLPSREFSTCTNTSWTTTPYQIGATSPPLHVVGHTGDLGNFTSAFWTIPDSNSAVVVLANASSANGDITHLVAQILIQALFNLQAKVDFVPIAREIVANAQKEWKNVVSDWTLNRQKGTSPKDLALYVGRYYDEDLKMEISVTSLPQCTAGAGNSTGGSGASVISTSTTIQEPANAEGQGHERSLREPCALRMTLNNLEDQVFDMYHYHGDSWTFLPATRDDVLKQIMHFYLARWDTFVVDFTVSEQGICDKLIWNLDLDSTIRPRVFTRVRE